MSRSAEIKRLLKNHNRRLQKLREEQSLIGLSAEPELLIEIEDIEQEIANLKAELDQIEGPENSTTHNLGIPSKTQQNSLHNDDIISNEFNRTLRQYISHHNLEYPLTISTDEFANQINQNTGIKIETAKGYLTAFFEILSLIGIARLKNSGIVELRDEINVAATFAMSLALKEGVSNLFDFSDSEDIEIPYYGSWFLHRLERSRLDHNRRREASRQCEHVVILVKAMLDGEEAILFQGEGKRAWGNYKFIGGRVRAEDNGDLSRAAIREIRQEVRTRTASASNITVTPLSSEPYQYHVISKRLGAYTLYQTTVYECKLELPGGCLKKSFYGEKGRETTWFPISQVTFENEELSQQEILAWLRSKGWLETARLSTSQSIKSN
ncbi:MAG: NUDIX hydrolase [Anaerolineae bacterium]|nr:NUDIX hydrolase [Anaerolineae bacterium]